MIEKNKIDAALENYQKSIATAKNSNQKFVVYERVGSLFYEKTNYVISAQYYDSAQRVLPQNYPSKKDFLKKVEALNRLLVQYNIYKSKDSILELAALGQPTTQPVSQPATLSFEEKLLSGARQSTITPEQQQILEAEMRQQQGSITNLADLMKEGDDIQNACK